MAWNYRRRIKIIPGIHLNFSKSGISTSIGVKGASITLSKKGTYLNTGIPGLGIYSRQKLAANKVPTADNVPVQDHEPEIVPVYNPSRPVDNIFSADPQEITSQNMQGVKETILTAHEQRLTLATDLQEVNRSLVKSKKGYCLVIYFCMASLKNRLFKK